jgi:hypothetical protein
MKKITTISALVLSLAFISYTDAQAAAKPADFEGGYVALNSLQPCALKQAIQSKAIGPTVDDMTCVNDVCTLPPQPSDPLANFRLVAFKDAEKGDLLVSFPSKEYECDMQASVLTSNTLPTKTPGRFHYLLRAK